MKKLQLIIVLLFVTFVTTWAQEEGLSEPIKKARKDLIKEMESASNEETAITAFFEKNTMIIKAVMMNAEWGDDLGQIFADILLKSVLNELDQDIKAVIRVSTKMEYLEIRVYNSEEILIGRSLKAFK
jgi:uncharacterized membrane protein